MTKSEASKLSELNDRIHNLEIKIENGIYSTVQDNKKKLDSLGTRMNKLEQNQAVMKEQISNINSYVIEAVKYRGSKDKKENKTGIKTNLLIVLFIALLTLLGYGIFTGRSFTFQHGDTTVQVGGEVPQKEIPE